MLATNVVPGILERGLIDEEAKTLIIDCIDPDDYELEELDALRGLLPLATLARSESGQISLDGVVVAGDLHIDGNLDIHGHVVVLGNLTCTGYLMSWVHCCVVVLGDVKAAAIAATRSYWLVDGDIASPVVWWSTYGLALHRGAIHTQLYVEDHYFERVDDCGAIEAPTQIVSEYVAKDETAITKLEALVRPEALRDEDGDIDSWQLLRAVSEGMPIFR